MKITIKANKKGLFIPAIILPAFMLFAVLLCIEDIIEDYNYWYTVLFALFVIVWLCVLDLDLAYYTLDENGFHHHCKLFTYHYKWSSFTKIHISYKLTTFKVICFNRGLRYESIYAGTFHPFRFHMFAIDEENGNLKGSLNGYPTVKRSEIIEFLNYYSLPYLECDEHGNVIYDSRKS